MRSVEGVYPLASRLIRRRKCARRATLLLAAALLLCARTGTRQHAAGPEPAREVAPGAPAAGDLGGADSHLFKIDSAAGHFVRVAVDKRDFQLSATLVSEDGRTISEHVSRRYGTLRLSFVNVEGGAAYLRLRSLESDGAPRRYELRVEEERPAAGADSERAAASDSYARAEALRERWDRDSLLAAVEAYADSSARAARAGDLAAEAEAERGAGECRFIMSEYREALAAHEKALDILRRLGDAAGEVDALNDVGYDLAYLGESDEALRHFERALALDEAADAQDEGARRRRALALNNTGEVFYSRGELRGALEYFERSLADAAGDRAVEALARLNLGYTHTDLGDLNRASEDYGRALALWQSVGDRRGEALTLTAVGGLDSFRGEKQSALDRHGRALRVLQALGNRQGEAATWNGIAQVYEDLGEPRAALNSYEGALRLYEAVGNREFSALTLYYVGRAWQALAAPQRAREYYERGARLSREAGNREFEAHALRGLGAVYESEGESRRALASYSRALGLYGRASDRRWQARTLNSIGFVHDAAGDKAAALGYYGRALRLARAVEDRREEVSTLYNMARAERDLGRAAEALSHAEPAVALVESLRAKVAGEQLRTSYFASAHQLYELYIDLLMQEHARRPGVGLAAAALQASERARARSLLERLEQQGAGHGPASDLPGRERALWQQLDFKLEAQTRLLNRPHTDAEAAAGAEEIRALTESYQQVLEEVRRQSPVYASLTQTRLLRAEEIGAEVPEGAVLLEYALGERRSYVWAVTPRGVEGHELPPRAEVEALAGEVYDLLTARQPLKDESAGDYRSRVERAEASYPARAAELSRVLLGPVAAQIEGKRLIVVCDGALHRVPFDALPAPGAAPASPDDFVPLVAGHEVVEAPSAAVLSALRGARREGQTPPRLIAVLADPVFDPQDPRVAARAGAPEQSGDDLIMALRDAGDAGGDSPLPRLGSSLREAEAVKELTPARERLISTGFDASLERVTGGELADFRIVHLATHGFFNDERPELSGLVFSRVDEAGRRREYFLKAGDIYDLRLNADLVVLSACRTGLGRHVNGEGLLGITRAFMYAGSRSVIASLWKVNDEATAELMKQFYGAMLRDGLPPSAALRRAKEAVRSQERWRSPYFWAGFVMQGECDRVPAARTEALWRRAAPAALPALALAAGLALWLTRRRKPRHTRAG